MTGVYVVEREARVRVAVTGAGPGVFRSQPHEAALAERLLPAVAREIDFPVDVIASDFHAPAAYRAHLISVMVERAIRSIAAADAAGE